MVVPPPSLPPSPLPGAPVVVGKPRGRPKKVDLSNLGMMGGGGEWVASVWVWVWPLIFIHPPIYSFTLSHASHPPTHLFIHFKSCISSTHPPTHPPTHPSTHLPTHPPTDSLTHPPTHPPHTGTPKGFVLPKAVAVGKRVRHPTWGVGRVVSVEEEEKSVEVDFVIGPVRLSEGEVGKLVKA